MLILLPTITYVLLAFLFTRKTTVADLTDALVRAHLIFFTIIVVSTEVLSIFKSISFPSILVFWLLVCFICLFASVIVGRRRDNILTLKKYLFLQRLQSFLLVVIAFILVSTFITAVIYPPNNWDSMTYHMARVANWISNKNVSFYPSAIPRQNYQMPLAEFAIMHFQILCGSDLFANLVQWVCFCISICLGALLAVELGQNRTVQLTSAFVIATLPMAILQSTSTQNDLVVSSFILSFTLFMLRLRREITVNNVLFASLSLGLALLTKGIAYIYCVAIGLSLTIPLLLKVKSNFKTLSKVTGILSLILICALIINTGHFYRNYQLYGHPLSTEGKMYFNQDLSASVLLSNTARNLALHLGTPSSRLNRFLYGSLKLILDEELNNPKTTWPGTSFYIPYRRHEDDAGNLIHMLLLLSAMSSVFIWLRQCNAQEKWYVLSVFAGALIYLSFLKWQPWASRLHTPLFMLSAPVIAFTLIASSKDLKRYVYYTALACLILYSIPYALKNETRRLISTEWIRKSRKELYFQNRPKLYKCYKNAMQFLEKTNVQEVGLYLDEDDWEYPFWVFAKANLGSYTGVRFFHVGVNNISRTRETDILLPAYVLATKSIDSWKDKEMYSQVYFSDCIHIFRKIQVNRSISTHLEVISFHLVFSDR